MFFRNLFKSDPVVALIVFLVALQNILFLVDFFSSWLNPFKFATSCIGLGVVLGLWGKKTWAWCFGALGSIYLGWLIVSEYIGHISVLASLVSFEIFVISVLLLFLARAKFGVAACHLLAVVLSVVITVIAIWIKGTYFSDYTCIFFDQPVTKWYEVYCYSGWTGEKLLLLLWTFCALVLIVCRIGAHISGRREKCPILSIDTTKNGERRAS